MTERAAGPRPRRGLPCLLLLLCLLLGTEIGAPHAAGAQGRAPQPQGPFLVVIDPGHGGQDTGARGPGGTLEKAVVLQISRELASILGSDPRFEVRLTRDADRLVPLKERTRLANHWRDELGDHHGALFLSIHLNAHAERSVRGLETYFLSEALTEDARRVAAFENSSQRFEEQAHADDALGFILNDLRQNHYLRESSLGAALFQRQLVRTYRGPDRGVKQARFVVLDGAFMPAILVELGFLSNPEDEALLTSGAQQRRLAEGLADAVRDFFGRPIWSDYAGGQ